MSSCWRGWEGLKLSGAVRCLVRRWVRDWVAGKICQMACQVSGIGLSALGQRESL